MSQKRDWIDYAQLGLLTTQTLKLSQISEELGRLREASDQQERKAERLAGLRRAVHLAGELLDRYEADAQGTETSLPRQFIQLHRTETMLQEAGILPPEGFEDWADMDRASRLGKQIEALRTRLLKTMPAEQGRGTELCLKYIEQMPALESLIEHRSHQERILADERCVKELQGKIVDLNARLATHPKGVVLLLRKLAVITILIGGILLLGATGTYLVRAFSASGMATQSQDWIWISLGITILGWGLWKVCKEASPTSYRSLEAECLQTQASERELHRRITEGRAVERFAPLLNQGEQGGPLDLDERLTADQLRVIHSERMKQVRGIVGESSLSQSAEREPESAASTADHRAQETIPWTHQQPLTIEQSVGRGMVMVIVAIAVAAVLVGLVVLLIG